MRSVKNDIFPPSTHYQAFKISSHLNERSFSSNMLADHNRIHRNPAKESISLWILHKIFDIVNIWEGYPPMVNYKISQHIL